MTRGTGLTATELSEALAELMPRLDCATIRDVARIVDRDDLLLFLESPEESFALHIVPGGPRSRVCCTQRRFPRALFQTGPRIDRLVQTLRGARLTDVLTPPGERMCTFDLRSGESHWSLHVELFGARGLWCLADSEGRIQALSRLPNTKGRDLRPGAKYAAPARRNAPVEDPPSRFEAPVLAAIDAFFTSADQDQERQALQRRLSLALERATRKLADKIDGLARQQTEIARIDELRSHADLLLAYGFSAAPGAESITVPDPNDPEAELVVPLAPGKPVQVQADKLYQRARKLEQGQAMAAQRRQQAESERDALEQLSAKLGSATEIPELEE
ncbi:MAG: NFACT family protein, partial [Planctomycetota bacterium]|nr:NFACT family protein [Planctomycetota bacterium]